MTVIPWRPPARGGAAARHRWREEMATWIGNALDWRAEALVNDANSNWHQSPHEVYRECLALGAARVGDIEPLRALYPRIAEFIHLPRRGQRGRYPRRRDGTMPVIDVAVEDAKFVKMLWREVYSRRNRRRGEVSAEEFVADYYEGMGHAEVTEAAILTRAKTFRVHADQTAWDAAWAREVAQRIRE